MIKKKFENFKIWCAASTHQNEEIIIGSLHKKLKKNTKNLLTIIIPRHIKRTNEIIKDLENINLKIITHSSKKLITNDTDVYLVDTYGEVSKFYELTNITFVGGSLIKHGGQNPLEPARLGNHIINGPYVNNFTEVYAFLKKNNVSLTIKNINQLKKIVSEKINYKISISNQKKIFNIGDKIISKNLFYIYKYL
jgi:3-deoxy-D-manno-octulosonic-acid transferase